MTAPRYVVGIDLGTSNCALAYAELAEVKEAGRPLIRELDLPQLIAAGDVQERRLLPSALYQPAEFELTRAQTSLPWTEADESEAPLDVVGEGAKRLGGKTPVRLIESAKSWLCHGGVNRSASILPWHAPEEIKKRSPVEVSAALLSHLRQAWDAAMAAEDPELSLHKQRVVITVPASFDEVARQLSLQAARKAGLPEVTLIEEPLAVFYAFLAKTGGSAQTTGLEPGQTLLIADVGGGTTDLTLVKVEPPKEPGGVLGFERTAVGDHLLLGGDNMDLALAHALEPTLSGKKLDAEGWAQLKHECRLAKEALFDNPQKAELPVSVAGRGSKLIGGTRRGKLSQEVLQSVVVDGYFPKLPEGEAARPSEQDRQAGFTEYGLPYAKEPAITRHIAGFLMRQAPEGAPLQPIDGILFNGGALKPLAVRDRVTEALGAWMRSLEPTLKDPRPVIYDEGDEVLELAVARGAAYFALAQLGLGLKVGGGSPREYFLGLDAEAEAPAGTKTVVCIAPRGMQDGQRIELAAREFQIVTNRPVQFPIYATTSPREDPLGEAVNVPEAELHELLPLHTVVKFGKQKPGTKVPVRLQVTRTELGTLAISCLSKMSGARFSLEFDLRDTTSDAAPAQRGKLAEADPFGGAGSRAPPAEGEISPERLEAAKARLDLLFGKDPKRPPPETAMKGLEADLGKKRDALPMSALRELAEHLMDSPEARELSPQIEERWLNLMGFFLRPGFGVPMDDWRVKQLWRIFSQDVLHPQEAVELSWWILWRRVAGGLSRGHQEELSSRLMPRINPALFKRAKKKPAKPGSQLAAEMWRAAASLEQLSGKQKAQIGGALLELVEAGKAPKGALWCMGRIAARRLLYGPREAVLRPKTAAAWAERLLKVKRLPKGDALAPAILSMARVTGDRAADLPEELRKQLHTALFAAGSPEAQLLPLLELVELDAGGQLQAFGDSLPTGFSLN